MSDKDFCCEYADKIWKRNKDIAEFEKAKSELKAELQKPFIKFLDWLERMLDK